MVRDEGVALLNLRRRDGFQYSRRTSGKGAHMKRQHHMLGDDFALGVEDRATGILRLSDDGRIAGAKQRILHLLDDAGQTGLYDLKSDGINHRISAES